MRKLFSACSLFMFISLCPTLLSAGNVCGKVVDSRDKPLGKLDILVEHMENRNSDTPDDFVIRAKTNDDGTFNVALPSSAEKNYEIYFADKNGHILCGYAHIDAAKENNLETVKLGEKCAVSGIVKDIKGKPLKDVKVVASMKTKDKCNHRVDVAEVKTGTDGNFEISDIQPGKYSFIVFSRELASETIESEVNEDLNYLDIMLKEGAKIQGKVLDENGKGIKDAKIVANGKYHTTISDGEGNFTLAGLKLVEYRLKATAKGYAMPGEASVKVDSKEPKTYQKDINLVKSGTLIVELEAGEKDIKIPANISLTLYSQSDDFGGSQDLNADVKEGKARFEDVAPGKYLAGLQSDEIPRLLTPITIETGKQANIKFIIPKTYTVSGKVVDDKGNPLKDAIVGLKFQSVARLSASDPYSTTQEDGTFTIKNLEAGKHKIEVDVKNFPKVSKEIVVGPDLNEFQTIALTKGLSLSGVILEADGKPAVNVKITLTNNPKRDINEEYVYKELEVSGDGKVVAEGLKEGNYNLSVTDAVLGYLLALVENVSAGSDDTIITLGKKFSVTGTIVDASGNPVQYVNCSATEMGGGRGMDSDSDRNSMKTDKNGFFKLDLREELTFNLEFSHPSFIEKSIDFDPAAGNSTLKVVLDKGYTVSGKVVREKDNSPVEGVIVKEMETNSDYYGSFDDNDTRKDKGITDKDGKFTLETVPSGMVKFSIYAQGRDGAIFSKNMSIKKDQKNEITIALPEMLEVSGKVLDAEGKPIPNAVVSLSSTENFRISHNAKSDEDGIFEISNVLPGKYSASFYTIKQMKEGTFESNPPEMIDLKAENAKGIILKQKAKAKPEEMIP